MCKNFGQRVEGIFGAAKLAPSLATGSPAKGRLRSDDAEGAPEPALSREAVTWVGSAVGKCLEALGEDADARF